MKYYLEDNVFLMLVDGHIYDEDGEEAYTFTYPIMNHGHPEIDLYRKNEYIGTVKESFRTALRRYDIYYKGDLIDILNQKYTRFCSRMVPKRLGWIIEGDFLARNYLILNENREPLASVRQELFRLIRHFSIDIHDPESESLLILLALAINQFDKEGNRTDRRSRRRYRRKRK